MKYRMILITLMCITVSLLAEEPKTIFNDEEGFVSLFNGKDLTGWEGQPELWSVVDGAIRGQTTEQHPARHNTFLVWQGGILKDFVLKLKFRIQNGNSGIQYRSSEQPDWVVSGYQAEVEDTPGKVGFLYHERGRGWLVNVGDIMEISKEGNKQVVGKIADVNKLIEDGYYKKKDWNEYTIIGRGNHLVHYLNGYQTIELIDNDEKAFLREGKLALQIHVGPPMIVDFKDIRVKNLTENYGKAFRLFNGKDLNDWTWSSPETKTAWGVRDGIMTNEGKPAGYIRTKKDYTNYILRLQMRHMTPGNCGVLHRMVGEDKVWPRSIECQGAMGDKGDIWNIDDFPMKTDPDRTNGRHTRKMYPSNEKPLEGWNEYEMYLNKGDLRIYVNGLLQNTATDCWETAGKICIQSEGSKTEFRNIVLIPIEN